MKKIGILAAFIAIALFVVPAFAAKPDTPPGHDKTCTTIQSGELLDSVGEVITTGYNDWGYNYQAKMYNGMWCDYHPYYREGGGGYDWCMENYADVELMMKWNDAWLSNQSCDEDNLLDRHYGYPTYIDSGAWLTNHAKGAYQSSTYHWNVTGNWMLDYNGGTDNRKFRNLVQDTDGNVTGEFWWLNGSNWEYGGTLVGTVSEDTLALHYDRSPYSDYNGDFVGTIGDDVITDGVFDDSHGNHLFWTATGNSEKVYETCEFSDFVKIVAVPSTAWLDDEVETFYEEGMWYEYEGGPEIGPAIWGGFAVIQEISDDPCGEYGVNYSSELRKGLGNWAEPLSE